MASSPAYRWLVTPLELPKVSSVAAGVQDTPDPAVRVTVTTPRIKTRTPDTPALANGRRADATCPVARVNAVAVPMAVPAALKKAMLPMQDAAGRSEERRVGERVQISGGAVSLKRLCSGLTT